MRVIAGKARRLNLKTISGLDTRPTIDRIKETLFNILNPYLADSCFLDLFSGSGGIGIEALSRGARFCVFSDNNADAIKCIKDNLEFTGLKENAYVIYGSALKAIKELSDKKYVFDFVYMDPPYHKGLEEETLYALYKSGIICKETLLIIEADKRNGLDFIDDSKFYIVREKEYKTNKHYFLKLKADMEDAG